MRAFLLPLIPFAVAAVSSVSFAAPALPFTTAPLITTASATTRPAPIRVMVAPFKSIGESDKDAWISQAIDEELTGDLTRNPAVKVLRVSSAMPVADRLKLANQQNAQRLVVGSYQTVDDQIRITGEVIDPADGESLGQLKVTGVKRDLFKLEDSLAAELEHVLPGAEQPDMSYTVTPVQSDGMTAQPQIVYQAPDSSGANSSVVYNPTPLFDSGYYGDGFDYGGYGYPFIYGGFLGYGGRNHGGHGGYGEGGYHNRQVGGGPIVYPVGSTPYGTINNLGQASFAPTHGFAGPVAGHATMGGSGFGGGHR